MKLLERLKESPFRYAVHWSMTAARPVIGYEAFRQARRGNWGKAQQLFVTAWATDMEGFPARYLNASSKAGAVADPVADGLLRAQSFAALAPEIPVTASIVAGAELYNLKLNGRIQNGRDRPYVPREAKWGTLIQAAGVIWTSEGIKREKKLQKLGGQASMLAGTGLRVYGYWKERQHGLSKHEHGSWSAVAIHGAHEFSVLKALGD
jgi:hypothetical protein